VAEASAEALRSEEAPGAAPALAAAPAAATTEQMTIIAPPAHLDDAIDGSVREAD
jgi:hypothetical protein